MIFTLYLIFFGIILVFISTAIILENIIPFLIALVFIFFIGSALLTTGVDRTNFITNVTNTGTGSLITEETVFTSVQNTSTTFGGSLIVFISVLLFYFSYEKMNKEKKKGKNEINI